MILGFTSDESGACRWASPGVYPAGLSAAAYRIIASALPRGSVARIDANLRTLPVTDDNPPLVRGWVDHLTYEVGAAVAVGLEPMLQCHCWPALQPWEAPFDPVRYIADVTELARRFPQVKYWSGWNEPEENGPTKGIGYPYPDLTGLPDLMAQFYDAVTAIIPGAVIIGPSVCNHWGLIALLKAEKALGRPLCHRWAANVYPWGQPYPSGAIARLRPFVDLAAGRGLWITETGDDNGPGGTGAGADIIGFANEACDMGVDAVLAYRGRCDSAVQFGFVDRLDQPLPTVDAFRRAFNPGRGRAIRRG